MKKPTISLEIKSFSNDSSIYGLRYLANSQRPWERTFWVTFCVLSVALSSLVVYRSLTDWKNDPLYTVIDTISYPVQKVPFPAVTVCPPGTDKYAFIEKILNNVKFQCYKEYGYSEEDCMESQAARESFRFLFKRMHQMALDATLKSIDSMQEAELKRKVLEQLQQRDIIENYFDQLLSYGSANFSSLEETTEKLANFIMLEMGRVVYIDDYVNGLKQSFKDYEFNDTVSVNSTIVDLMKCLRREPCGHWIKVGLAYIDLFRLYGNFKVWDLGSMVVYFSHIIESNTFEPSEEELLLDAHFQDIFRSISASNSNLSAYDIIGLLGFDSNAMKPDFLPDFTRFKSIWNETNIEFIYGTDGKMTFKEGCYIGSYEREWLNYMQDPENGRVPCADESRAKEGGFDACCKIKKELHDNTYDVIQMSKYTQYPPHLVDQNERDPYNLLRMPDFLKKIQLKYPLYNYSHLKGQNMIEHMTNSDREILESLIPFCAFDSEWETIPYGMNYGWTANGYQGETATRNYCKSFSPSFTDRGICYSWNSLEPKKLFSESEYIQQTNDIFQYKTNESSSIVYPTANGPNNGFRFIVDMHTFSSMYKRHSNTNKNVEIVLHEGTEIPYFKGYGFKVSAGMETDITVSMSDLYSTDEIKVIDKQTRKCRFRNEPIFSTDASAFMKVYSQTSCFFQCQLEVASKVCGCMPWFYPRLPDISVGLCDSYGNKCVFETMNLNPNTTKSCIHCEYDCNKITYSSSFMIRPIDPEAFCTDEVNYPIVDIKKYINIEPNNGKNPKLFYLKWKELVGGKEYQLDNNKHCQWKAKNDFAIINVHLSTPTIPRMKQDVKQKLHNKLSILGGLLGLSCGFNMLSIFEIMFYIIRNCFSSVLGKKGFRHDSIY